MTTDLIKELLHKIGWVESAKIPLANAENVALQAQLEELGLRRHKANTHNENEKNRYNALKKHLKYLNQESEQNQLLIAFNRQQLENDQHHFKLKECERSKLRNDIKQFQKEAGEISNRSDIKRNNLTNAMTKIEKIKTQYEWDAEAAKAWEDNLKKRDEDTQLLRKFSKQDEKKAKDLEAKRVNLQIDVNKRKEMIQKMVAEITNYEQIMERTAKMAKQLKEEKKTLLVRWQETVKNLRQRDEDIARVTRDLETALEVAIRQKNIVEEQNAFYKTQVHNNEQLSEEIQEFNTSNSRLRRELNEAIEIVLQMTNDCNTMKRAVMAISQELDKARVKSKMMSKDIDVKLYQISVLDQEIDMLNKKLEETINSSANSADRAKYLEDIIEYENKQTNVLGSELSRTQNSLYRTQKKLDEHKITARVHEMDIQGYQVSMNILQRTIAKNMAALEKCKEEVYDLDFRKCNMEMKLQQVEGTVTDDKLKETVEKIRDLQSVIAHQTEIQTMLELQILRMNDERRRLTNTITFDNKAILDLRNKLQNFILLYQGSLKYTEAARVTSQKKQVEENLLRLKVDNLAKGMEKQDKTIYNMQKFRLELDTAMTERKIEIDAHKDVLLAKKKNLEEELGRLRMDITGRCVKIKQLKGRFDVAMSLLGKDDCGQPLTVTHFKIKTAQEKYLLQIQGDELDKKIRTAEKEIVAMENTLKVVNYSNSKFKETLTPVGEHDQEIKDMKTLQKEFQDTNYVLRSRKKVLKKETSDLSGFDIVLDERNAVKNQRLEVMNELQIKLKSFVDNMEDNKAKIKRANRHITRIMTTLHGEDLQFDYKDFALKTIQNTNFSTMIQLRTLPKKYPETGRCVAQYFAENNLEMKSTVIKSTGSSFSEEPVASIISSTSSEASKIDYSLKLPQVNVSLQFELSEESIKKSRSRISMEPKKKKKLKRSVSIINKELSTMAGLYKLSNEEKEGMVAVSIEKVHSSNSSLTQSTKTKHTSYASSDDSQRVPSSLFYVSPPEEEEEEEGEGEEDEKKNLGSPSF